jgi:hypothetical protein
MSSVANVPNFYNMIPRSESGGGLTYKNYSKIKIDVPMQGIIIGKTGSGKSNLLLYLLQEVNCWNKIILLCKKPDEPLYNMLITRISKLEKKFKEQIIYVCTSIEELPSMDDFSGESTLFIADDQVCEGKKTQAILGEYWIRSRKNGISCLYLSQSFYLTPKLIRENSSLCFLKTIVSVKDLKRILSEYALTEDPSKIMQLYEKIRKSSPMNFLLIDKNTADDNLRYRFNFSPVDIKSLQ